jgi:hypothetical protein
MGIRLPTLPHKATLAFTPSQLPTFQRSRPNPQFRATSKNGFMSLFHLHLGQIKINRFKKEGLCEISLKDIRDGPKVIKTSCCRLLAHTQCLSTRAHTKIRGSLLKGGSSFTCPKCRARMDLAEYGRQLPHVNLLIEEPGRLASYDIDTAFTPLPQPQKNP